MVIIMMANPQTEMFYEAALSNIDNEMNMFN